jgi:hypothetical protein
MMIPARQEDTEATVGDDIVIAGLPAGGLSSAVYYRYTMVTGGVCVNPSIFPCDDPAAEERCIPS